MKSREELPVVKSSLKHWIDTHPTGNFLSQDFLSYYKNTLAKTLFINQCSTQELNCIHRYFKQLDFSKNDPLLSEAFVHLIQLITFIYRAHKSGIQAADTNPLAIAISPHALRWWLLMDKNHGLNPQHFNLLYALQCIMIENPDSDLTRIKQYNQFIESYFSALDLEQPHSQILVSQYFSTFTDKSAHAKQLSSHLIDGLLKNKTSHQALYRGLTELAGIRSQLRTGFLFFISSLSEKLHDELLTIIHHATSPTMEQSLSSIDARARLFHLLALINTYTIHQNWIYGQASAYIDWETRTITTSLLGLLFITLNDSPENALNESDMSIIEQAIRFMRFKIYHPDIIALIGSSLNNLAHLPIQRLIELSHHPIMQALFPILKAEPRLNLAFHPLHDRVTKTILSLLFDNDEVDHALLYKLFDNNFYIDQSHITDLLNQKIKPMDIDSFYKVWEKILSLPQPILHVFTQSFSTASIIKNKIIETLTESEQSLSENTYRTILSLISSDCLNNFMADFALKKLEHDSYLLDENRLKFIYPKKLRQILHSWANSLVPDKRKIVVEQGLLDQILASDIIQRAYIMPLDDTEISLQKLVSTISPSSAMQFRLFHTQQSAIRDELSANTQRFQSITIAFRHALETYRKPHFFHKGLTPYRQQIVAELIHHSNNESITADELYQRMREAVHKVINNDIRVYSGPERYLSMHITGSRFLSIMNIFIPLVNSERNESLDVTHKAAVSPVQILRQGFFNGFRSVVRQYNQSIGHIDNQIK